MTDVPSRTLRLAKLTVALVPIAILSACGQAGIVKGPPLDRLPVVPGAMVVAQSTQCDRGSNPYCAVQIVVVDSAYRSSKDLVDAEHLWIHKHGWQGVPGDIGDERAAVSPDQTLHVTYGTADGDLRGIDLGWIHRSPQIADALSRTLFAHTAAMSVMLETGSA
jgi:hypothetical protein